MIRFNCWSRTEYEGHRWMVQKECYYGNNAIHIYYDRELGTNLRLGIHSFPILPATSATGFECFIDAMHHTG